MKPILESYLDYLNEQGTLSAVKGFAKSSAKDSLLFTAGIAAATLAWKAAKTLMSQATRKCGGGFKTSTPGFKLCVSRERIKAYQEMIVAAKKRESICKSEDEMCKEKWNLESRKLNNRILAEKNKIKEILGEQVNPLLTAAKWTGAMVIGTFIDKGIFLANRTFQSAFSQALRKCGTYKDNTQHKLCMAQQKSFLLSKKLNSLNKLLLKCGQSKDSAKCEEKLQKNIDKTNRDLQIQKDNVVVYKNDIENEKREAELRAAMKMQAARK